MAAPDGGWDHESRRGGGVGGMQRQHRDERATREPARRGVCVPGLRVRQGRGGRGHVRGELQMRELRVRQDGRCAGQRAVSAHGRAGEPGRDGAVRRQDGRVLLQGVHRAVEQAHGRGQGEETRRRVVSMTSATVGRRGIAGVQRRPGAGDGACRGGVDRLRPPRD